jgi:hypothetical protein
MRGLFMEMSLTHIADLLMANGQSATVFQSIMQNEQRDLSLTLVIGRNIYRLTLHQYRDEKSWSVSEVGHLMSSVIAPSSVKVFQSTKSPAASCYDQLSLWP